MSTQVSTFLVFAVLLIGHGISVDPKKDVTNSDLSTRIYNSNHPPLSEYDDISVKVINNDDKASENSKVNVKPKEVIKKIINIEDDLDTFDNNESNLFTTTRTTTKKTELINGEIRDISSKNEESKNNNNSSLENGFDHVLSIASDDLDDIDLTELYDKKDINVRNGIKPKGRSLNVETSRRVISQESDKLNNGFASSNTSEATIKGRRVAQRKRAQKVPKAEIDNTEIEPKIITIDSISPNTKQVVEKYKKLSSSFMVPGIPIIPDKQSSSINNKIGKRTGTHDPVIPIVESENYVFSHRGDFHYSYEGGDGTRAFEKGELKTIGGGTGEAVEGSFSYTDKDGNDFSLTYTADENGYRPVGAHLPTPPPIPPAIQRALDLLATKTTPAESATEKVKKYN